MRKLHTSGVAVSLLAAAVMMGCENTTNNTSNPNPNTLVPTGTIQGTLTDSQTGEPVVGAVINIGVANATTDANGQYVMRSVPANTRLNETANIGGTYTAVIDTSAVTSPINMATTTGAKYTAKDTTCNGMNVVFSSLAESTTGGGAGASNGANHDTPITGLAAVADLTIGKMSATITGTVFDVDGSTAVEGALVDATVGGTIGGAVNAGALCGGGALVVASATTAADGTYTISGIEAGLTPTIRAQHTNNDKAATFTFPAAVVENRTYNADNGANLVLGYNDTVAPTLISTSVENNADVATGADIAVIFTWNEAIVTNEYTDNITKDATLLAGVNTIYNDVTVNYNGAKTGNVAHTLAWNAERTQLTVTIPSASVQATSSYTINASAGRTNNRMTDKAGNTYVRATNVVDIINITTNGGTDLSGDASKPALTITNNTVDYNTFPVMIDWLPIAGAASYDVYRSSTGGATTIAKKFIGNVTTSSFSDSDTSVDAANGGVTGNATDGQGYENNFGTTALLNGDFPVTNSYTVVPVNANHTAGAESAALSVKDTVSPRLNALAANFAVADSDGDNQCDVTLSFNEPVAEAAAETAANYTFNPGPTVATLTASTALAAADATLTSAPGVAPATVLVNFPYASSTNCVDFTDDADDSEILIVNSAVTDVAGNAIDASFDVLHQDGGNVAAN